MESFMSWYFSFYKSQTRRIYIESYILYDVYIFSFYVMATDHPCDSGTTSNTDMSVGFQNVTSEYKWYSGGQQPPQL